MSKTYWQIAAGAFGRNYTDYFIKHGIAFVGGDSQIKAMKDVTVGDIVVLKQGLSQIVAAGEVVERDGKAIGCEDKLWLRDFDGWDLPAYCYVDWHIPDDPIKTSGLTINTIQRLPQSRHQQIANDLLLLPVHNHEPEPSSTNMISDDQLLEHLIAEGLRASSAADLTNTINRIRLLAKYYYEKCTWSDVREHETRSFLVVPLLLALGWSEQQLKIELPCNNGKIDIACFPKPFKNKSERECILIVETKGFEQGLDYAPQQAHLYAKDFPTCRGVLVTNGYCYKAYMRKEDGSFDTKPSAYLNLLQPRDKYPLDPTSVGGALSVFGWLLPANIR
ncbi:MAG: hypothetical protein HZA16_10600 [Nitrospirae bacterium]|nr:hypothetical protein [Nitrospirota bacterium]